ncbi:MAG: hypothetical protein U9R19_07125, partial [Bacteroidota bacterium]|nr:hypothetical protein [Bacteroidota bacterium]
QALGWVLYDFLKQQIEKASMQGVERVMKKIVEISRPSFEDFFFERVVKSCSYFLYTQRQEKSIMVFPKDLAVLMLKLPYKRPSLVHSKCLETMLNYKQEALLFLGFARYWGPMNFLPVDFEKRQNKAGRFYCSLAESYVGSLSKAYYSARISQPEANEQTIFFCADEIIEIIEFAETKIRGNIFFNYYKALLLFLEGRVEEARRAFSLLLAQKPNDSWAWGKLAGLYTEKPEQMLPLLCKALICPGPGEMKVKLHEKLGLQLYQTNNFGNAKRELNRVIAIRNNNNWPLPDKILQILDDKNMLEANIVSDSRKFYLEHAAQAFRIAFKSTPYNNGIITDVAKKENKTIVTYMISREEIGRFRLQDWMPVAEPGQTGRIYFKQETGGRVIYWEPLEIKLPPAITRTVTGKLKIFTGKNFGFINNVFVPPTLYKQIETNTTIEVKVLAVSAYDKTQRKWGWRAIKIIK